MNFTVTSRQLHATSRRLHSFGVIRAIVADLPQRAAFQMVATCNSDGTPCPNVTMFGPADTSQSPYDDLGLWRAFEVPFVIGLLFLFISIHQQWFVHSQCSGRSFLSLLHWISSVESMRGARLLELTSPNHTSFSESFEFALEVFFLL